MPLATEPEVARTYATPVDDAWAYVLQYRETLDYVAANPDKGSTAVSTALDLPRSRVREWMDGSVPDVVRGLQTARDHGWFPDSLRQPAARALNRLVAAVFATGSIALDNYRPSFVVDDATRDVVADALATLGVGSRTIHTDDDRRATELVPRRDGAVLGRVLAAAGAPVGPKVQLEALRLPTYLDDAPLSIQVDFVELYVDGRGTELDGKATTPLLEQRNETFRRDLAALVSRVTDEPVSVGTNGVYLSATAARRLGVR
ncbi:hypothetical protein C5C07_13230 [Haloferax sp. Atlit-4N]|uniref:Uncharacterized protein n=1 Tax=Haloferax gibbonsii TaxID=35746 RepID=A0A871BJ45_HALGI|nr:MULTISPECIES: hypothetical protein [Haloferax]QOS12754.1 uncharacterized protein HfgLR_13130 [Haloferax gibbonsii]RDZ52723.1 hypothetical protein C5C07_13230 [Haloferax sp. Atlit-4N]